jgi:hypothetical protein
MATCPHRSHPRPAVSRRLSSPASAKIDAELVDWWVRDHLIEALAASGSTKLVNEIHQDGVRPAEACNGDVIVGAVLKQKSSRVLKRDHQLILVQQQLA